MLLNHGERVVFQESVERESDGRHGTLTLTNQRFLFEVVARQGLISSALHGERTLMDMDVPILQLSDAQVQAHLLGRPVLLVRAPGALPTLQDR